MVQRGFLALFREMAGIENVVGVGRGHKWVRGENTGREAAVILVRKKQHNSDLRRSAIIPRQIDGMVTDVIEVGDVRLLNDNRKEMIRPAQPGASIGHYKVSAGTFGAVVYDLASGEPLILSNNHVLANLSNGRDERAQPGDVILQPGMYDGGEIQEAVIGHLKRFIPVHSEVNKSRCRIANLFETVLNQCVHMVKPHYRIQVLRENEQVNLVDCAVAVPVSPESISAGIIEVGAVAGVKEAKPGMTIKKSGRSSGLTFSMVLATDVTLKIGVGHSEYGIFSEQILAGPMSMPGDSGSLVLSEDNHAVGLLFAGSEQATMFSPIDRVLAALEVRL
ncbi:MAG: hypothetical protein P4N59_31175 [Negativicutes bacterium]|nr:hypothetical protein [Negativicutes bacterium]